MDCQKILVIDDEPSIHRLVEARLKDLGVKVMAHDRGEGAIDIVKQHEPDLILLDVNMPGLTGFEVIKLLKSDATTYSIPVIFLTGSDTPEQTVKGFNLGAVDYVTKPFDAAILRARVRAALNAKAMMDMLMIQAQIDGLTGLHNRRFFDERLEQELDAAKRYARDLGLIMVDIDFFKRINDLHGHPKGDRVLKMISNLLGEACRASDVPCRYGGEEFTILLSESSIETSIQCAERILQAVRDCKEIYDLLGQQVTISIGVTAIESGQVINQDLFVDHADQALYQAKKQGRDRLVVYNQLIDNGELAA